MAPLYLSTSLQPCLQLVRTDAVLLKKHKAVKQETSTDMQTRTKYVDSNLQIRNGAPATTPVQLHPENLGGLAIFIMLTSPSMSFLQN